MGLDLNGVKLPVNFVLLEEIQNIVSELEAQLKIFKNSRILITGSSGHLGFYFLHTLLEANKLMELNLKITALSREKLNHAFDLYSKDFTSLLGDLTDLNFATKINEQDIIFHLAGYAQPLKFISDPNSTIILNTSIVQLLIKKLSPIGSLLFISSAEVYTNSNAPTHTEQVCGSVNSNHPRAAYIYSKLIGESICNHESKQSTRNIKVARLSATYGPGIKEGDTRAVSDFFFNAIRRKKITLIDRGEAIREYLYISDAVKALLKILTAGKHNIYNIGAGKEGQISIAEVAKSIAKIAKADLEIPTANNDILASTKDANLDISRYKAEFGNLYSVPFEAGINKTFHWLLSERIS